MKIKLALLEKDQIYLYRIVAAFKNKFDDRLEVYPFIDLEEAMSILKSNEINVFISNEYFEVDCSEIPPGCGFAYFSESLDVETIRSQKTICKFQKLEYIYKEILGIYSENATRSIGLNKDTVKTEMITFTSASGGVGTSTIAASCAKYFAKQGKKTLFLSLGPFENINYFFQGDGHGDLSDIMYAVKDEKSSLELKIDSIVKQEASGVYFYDSPKSALDIIEFTKEEFDQLLESLKTVGRYEYIVMDSTFSLGKKVLDILNESNHVVFITDGSEKANEKFQRAYSALDIISQEKGLSILERIAVIYNQFSDETGQFIGFENIKNIGRVPKFEETSLNELMDRISDMEMFQNIIG